MARFLYVFPHPDDESFGPGAAMAKQCREGHEVHLLTLTRGGATRIRHDLGYSVEEMGRVREAEMQAMARVLGLASLTVLDLPDGGLKELDPRQIEAAVAERVAALRPAVLVTHPAHGVSGFEDHLVTHAVVKRLFCQMRDDGAPTLRRLAFTTLCRVPDDPDRPIRLKASKPEEVDAIVPVEPVDLDTQRRALACYETYREVIAAVDPVAVTGGRPCFEIFGEDHTPPLSDLAAELP